MVVQLTMPELPDVPAEFWARTRYRYVVLAVRPPSTKDVEVDVPTCAKLVLVAPVARSIRYWLTVPDEAAQFSDTELDVVVQVGVPGVPGGCVPVPWVVQLTMPELPEVPAEFWARTR